MEMLKNKIINFFWGDNKKIEKNSAFWNMLFSMLSALQSAIMIMVVTRVVGTDNAGILSIAYATGYLMYTVGSYGVRNFQATDSQSHYSYNDYRKMRLVSCFAMVFASLLYCLWKGYNGYKASVVLLVCLLKLEEVIEDLYHGELQRVGRLDVAGRLGTFRLILCYVGFIFSLLITQNLLLAISHIIGLSFIMIVVTRILLNEVIAKESKGNKNNNLSKLIIACFPLFVMGFFNIYITNAPKYAIDIFLPEKEQAYFAIISMPVFTINLLSGIVYRPKLLHMAELWNTDSRLEFKTLIWKQIRNVIIISVVIMVGGLTIGIRILEILYGVSLITLKKEFAILLVGGGMVAIYNFLSACLTIMRRQIYMLTTAILMMLVTFVISNPIVRYAGLTGASYLYFILMLGEMLIVSVILYVCLRRQKGS